MTSTTGSNKGATGGRSSNGEDQGVVQTARQVADTVAGAAGEVGARLPEVASSTRDAFTEANRMVRSGSDQTLKVAGSFSIGLAVGLLLGGANRLLVILALIPAGLIGAQLMERTEPGSDLSDAVLGR
jgi:hypothetical protein